MAWSDWLDSVNSLWYATKVGSAWVRELVDSVPAWPEPFGPALNWVSIAVGPGDQPYIAYVMQSSLGSWEVRLAHRNGTVWVSETVATSSVEIGGVEVVFDLGSTPHLKYLVGGSGPLDPPDVLKFASWNGTAWQSETVYEAPELDAGALAFDSTGGPRVSFLEVTNGELMYARKLGAVWVTEVVDSNGRVGWESDLALDLADQPHMSYWGPDARDLFHARWTLAGWAVETVDNSAGDVGQFSGIGVDGQGRVHIAYWDWTNHQVKYALGVPQNPPPASALLAVSPYWRIASPLLLEATASDPNGPVASVDLVYRRDGGGVWGPWMPFGTDATAPWQWAFPWPQGEGRYEFYSQAFDGEELELQPPVADTAAGYDATPPSSVVLPVVPYMQTTSPLSLTTTAADALSGVATMTLRYRHAPDNATWGPWTDSGTLASPPWQWDFPFPDGPGYYEFLSLAADVAGNAEVKSTRDALALYALPLAPPRNLTTRWDGGVHLAWEPPPFPADAILLYRSPSTTFLDLGSTSPQLAATLPGAATSWDDSVPLAAPGEAYYVARAAYGSDLSPTSNTAGFFAGTLRAGLTAISRPLEYFPWVDYAGPEPDTVGEYRTAFGATAIRYLDANGHWSAADPGTPLAVGSAYLVTHPAAGTFAFAGLPGSHIAFDETAFAGFRLGLEASSLTPAVAGDDVILAWLQPPGMAGGTYQVWSSPSRTGFFDGAAAIALTVPAPGTPDITATLVGALTAADEAYYRIVPVNAAAQAGSPTYSVGAWAKAFAAHDTFGLPLRPTAPVAVSALADAIPGALGVLWLTAGGDWVPHFPAMASGTYDADMALGAGYQVSVAPAGPVRYAFVGK